MISTTPLWKILKKYYTGVLKIPSGQGYLTLLNEHFLQWTWSKNHIEGMCIWTFTLPLWYTFPESSTGECWFLKEHWTTSASSPDIFFLNWYIYTIWSVYLWSDCMLNLTCNFNLVTKIFENFLQGPLLEVDFQKRLPQSWLLTLVPSTIILVWRNILKLVCAVLWTDTKNNWTFDSNMNTNYPHPHF